MSKEVLTTIIRGLVADKDNVTITETSDEMGVLLAVDVAKKDMGRVIGKSGETARAIRTIIRAIGMTENKMISLKINEPEHGN